MTLSRGMFLFALLCSLGWIADGQAAAAKPSESIAGTWYSAKNSITFNANGTIHYRGKKYYYAVSNGGMIQLKGKDGEITIPYQRAGGKLTLVEGGKTTIYRRRR